MPVIIYEWCRRWQSISFYIYIYIISNQILFVAPTAAFSKICNSSIYCSCCYHSWVIIIVAILINNINSLDILAPCSSNLPSADILKFVLQYLMKRSVRDYFNYIFTYQKQCLFRNTALVDHSPRPRVVLPPEALLAHWGPLLSASRRFDLNLNI